MSLYSQTSEGGKSQYKEQRDDSMVVSRRVKITPQSIHHRPAFSNLRRSVLHCSLDAAEMEPGLGCGMFSLRGPAGPGANRLKTSQLHKIGGKTAADLHCQGAGINTPFQLLPHKVPLPKN